jgi:hypothetical protein
MFKNSFKLLIANFSTVWKLILYYLIVLGIVIGLLAPFFGVIQTQLNNSGVIFRFAELISSFNVSVNFIGFVSELYLLIIAFGQAFLALFVSNVWSAIYIAFVLLYLFPVFLGLADLAVGQTLLGYMSSLTKYNFVGSYVRIMGRSIRFQLFKNLIYLPINALISIVFVATLKLTEIGGLMVYFLPIIIIFSLILMISLKRTIFAGWMPAIVVYDCNMFVAFGKGIKAVFKRFFKVLSTALCMTIIVIAISYLFGTYALLVVIPVSIMFFYVFEMVVFYSSQGMRFYVDLETIVKPKLLEECDSFKKIKDII